MSHQAHAQKELEEMAKAHNMSVEELQQHIAEHENMEFGKTHELLLKKDFSEEEIRVMAEEHNMSVEDFNQHLELARKHHQ